MRYFDGVTIVLTLVCGYLLYRGSWWDNKKYERHIFYLRILTTGVLWQGAWHLCAWLASPQFGWVSLPAAIQPIANTSHLAFAFSSIAVPLVVYGLVQLWHKCQNNKRKADNHIKFFKESNLCVHELLARSFSRESMVMVTLDTHKVYIGWVSEYPPLHEDMTAISIVPALSGYRGSSGQLQPTTDYIHAVRSASPQVVPVLTIKYEKVVSIQSFDVNLYAEFLKRERKQAADGTADDPGKPEHAG